jgi:hypothetical protein
MTPMSDTRRTLVKGEPSTVAVADVRTTVRQCDLVLPRS